MSITGNLRCLLRRLFFRIGADIFLIIVIPAAFVLIALAYNLRENVRDVTLSMIENRLKNKADSALGKIDSISDDLSFVAKHLEKHFSGLGGGVKRIANGVPPPDWYRAAKYKNFMDDLETMILMNNAFLKVRIINNAGREIIRFDRAQSGIKEIPFGELEDKSGRDYFKNAMAYPAGKAYLHPITLDVERGEILQPYTPVMRVCRKIALNGGETLGVIVLTVRPDVIFGPENRSGEPGSMIIDEAGNYLRHRDPNLLLAGELGGKANLLNEIPLMKANIGKYDSMTVFDRKMGEYWVWRKIFYREGDRSHFWVFVERHPEFSIVSGYTDILVKNAVILAFVVFAGFFLVVAVIYRALRPLRDITAAIRKLETGDMTARAPADAKNEIGEIAGAFNSLADRLNETSLELQRAMALAKSISDIAPTAHIIASSGGIILSVNPATTAMFGYTAREMLGQSVKMLAPSVKDDEYSKYIRDYFSFKESGLPEKRNMIRTPREMLSVRKNGEIFYVSLYVKEALVDGEEVFAGIIEDITDKKEAETALRESFVNNEAIMAATGETLALIGREGNIIAINKTGAERFGKKPSDLIGKTIFDILPLDLALSRMNRFEEVTRSGKPLFFEDLRGDRWISNSVYPVFNEKGSVTKFALFATDITEHKQSEERLAESSRELSDALNLLEKNAAISGAVSRISPVGHIVADSWGDIISSNPAVEKMFGYAVGELPGKNVKVLSPSPKEDEYSKYIRDYADSKKTGLPDRRNTIRVPKELLAVKKNGEFFYVSLYIKEVLLSGEFMFVGIIEDITERREAEVSLKEAFGNIDAIMNASNESIALIGLEGNFISVNEAGAKRLNKKRADISGKSLFDIFPLKLAMNRMEYFEQVARTGKPLEFEDMRGDRAFASSIYPVFDASGKVIRFALFAVDVTERKRMENTLKEREARMRAILTSAPNAIITIDGKGTIETFNPAGEKIFGYPAEEAIGENVKILMPEPYQSEHDGYIEKYFRTGMPRVIGQWRELEGRRKDGSIFPLELNVTEILVEGRRLFVGVVHDITEVKKLKQLKDDFFHAVVHDLKSPITGIQLELGMLGAQIESFSAECSAKEPCQKTFSGYELSLKQKITDISEGIDQLYLMIQSLLKLGEIEEEKLELHYVPFAMNDLLGELERDFRGRAASRKVAVEFRNAFTGTVIADFGLLKRVLQNLIDNAIKYCSANTAITVEAVCARKAGGCDNILISVTNTGKPLTENKINSLFQKFKTLGHAESGSGIGLFFCYKTMNALDGGICVDQDATAITFHIYFPNG